MCIRDRHHTFRYITVYSFFFATDCLFKLVQSILLQQKLGSFIPLIICEFFCLCFECRQYNQKPQLSAF